MGWKNNTVQILLSGIQQVKEQFSFCKGREGVFRSLKLDVIYRRFLSFVQLNGLFDKFLSDWKAREKIF